MTFVRYIKYKNLTSGISGVIFEYLTADGKSAYRLPSSVRVFDSLNKAADVLSDQLHYEVKILENFIELERIYFSDKEKVARLERQLADLTSFKNPPLPKPSNRVVITRSSRVSGVRV